MVPRDEAYSDVARKRLLKAFELLLDSRWRARIGLPILLEETDYVLEKENLTKKYMSHHVEQIMSSLSVLAEVMNQLDCFPPCFSESMEDNKEALQSQVRATQTYMEMLPRASSWEATLDLGVPLNNRFDYPSAKKPTKTNAEMLRYAESELDHFWAQTVKAICVGGKLSPRCLALLDTKDMIRTQPWEHEGVNTTPDQSSKKASFTFQNHTIGGSQPDDGLAKHEALQTAKALDEARGRKRAEPEIDDTELEAPEVPGIQLTFPIQVDQRSLACLRMLFTEPKERGNAGSLAWAEVLHTMADLGFPMENLRGSKWWFGPHPALEGGPKSILIHKPHPRPQYTLVLARRLGRRLQRRFGWGLQTFSERE